jgi:LL-diaminopimelate aminotransferase
MSGRQPSRRLQKLTVAFFAEMAERKQQVAARMPVIDLGIGSPDTPPAPHLIETIERAVKREDLYGYPLTNGTYRFRKSVADWYRYRFGVELNPDGEVHALMGSQDGLAHLALAWTDPGDVVLVPDPGYPIYEGSIHLAGADMYRMPLRAENGYLPDLGAIPEEICRRAKLMILNYPNNPLSATAPLSFFEEAVQFAKRYDIVIAHDAAYSEMAYDGYRPPSFLQAKGAMDVAIEFNSFSKSFQMAGCRIGYVVGNADIIRPLAVVKSNIDYGVFLPVQEMAIAALEADRKGEYPNRTSELYQRRRDVLVSELRKIGWDVPSPKATMFVWAPIPAGWTSRDFVYEVLERAGVVLIPGDVFGPEGEGYVRIGLVQDEETLAEAAKRIGNTGLFTS